MLTDVVRVDQELWNKQSASKASDVYALGILFAEIVSREVPVLGESIIWFLRFIFEFFFVLSRQFDGVEPLVIRDRVLQEKRMPLPPSCSASVKALIEKCWSHDPLKRPSALQVLMALNECH
jgi:serine/threonine protein kinase